MADIWRDLKMISLEGVAVKDFLQGYITSDAVTIQAEIEQPFAICNLRGRVLSNGWALGDDHCIKLYVHASLAQRTAEFLSRYAMFSKCDIAIADEAPRLYLRAPEERTLLPGWSLCDAGYAGAIEEPTATSLSINPYDMLIERKHALISKPSSERFLPQALGLDLVGAVDFKKGCYLGQEIVARTHFRGALKRKLALFKWQGEPPVIGENWKSTAGQEGEVVMVSESSATGGNGLWVTQIAS
tara:strand:+ start:32487 stop:33215 length:729 start_codon:yes stop_codon:yes gene_type:complete